MTRVVPDQKAKFETDELFRKLSRESEVSKGPSIKRRPDKIGILDPSPRPSGFVRILINPLPRPRRPMNIQSLINNG